MSVNTLEIPYALDPKNPFLIDKRSGPWPTIVAANAGIPMEVRVRGLIVIVTDGIGAYFYRDGITDDDLVPLAKDEGAVWGHITGILSEQTDLNNIIQDLYKKTSHTHTQDAAATVWVVNHDMGKNPSVSVVDTAGQEMMGEVRYGDLNNLTITFSHLVSGKAYLN